MRLYSGTGNVFVLADERFEELPTDPVALLAQQRRESSQDARADGLIHVSFELERPRTVFYNLDGSRPEACGNGLRCAAFHIADTGGPNAFELDTDAGSRRARVLEDGQVEVSMGSAVLAEPRSIELPSGSLELVPVRVGNPHAVLFVADPAAVPVHELGPQIERHDTFPGGANVEFCAIAEQGLNVRIWERGVGETRACGTGACAAAAVAQELGHVEFPVAVTMPGGSLTITSDELGLAASGQVLRLDERSSGAYSGNDDRGSC